MGMSICDLVSEKYLGKTISFVIEKVDYSSRSSKPQPVTIKGKVISVVDDYETEYGLTFIRFELELGDTYIMDLSSQIEIIK